MFESLEFSGFLRLVRFVFGWIVGRGVIVLSPFQDSVDDMVP